ncbi:hypothetical protein D9757_014318 [Collybiopsis confluens]|uniref:Uncharacterized protein n=1 Tax=Collybiopsis confluens TaxID=2823264 RepID=A0A8H5CT88_9AGAR|nr:hypothetical protein D9757_014318 [Collybiopsis confluens]
MVVFRHLLSKRDVILLLLGATLMDLTSLLFFCSSNETSVIMDRHVPLHKAVDVDLDPLPPPPKYLQLTHDKTRLHDQDTNRVADDTKYPIQLAPVLPPTSILHHAPGYNMSNGTLYILSSTHKHETLRQFTQI